MNVIPIKPEDLADTMQNRAHHEVGISRPAKSLKIGDNGYALNR